MSKILSVNAGSSSLKFKLFDMPEETVLAAGLIERIGSQQALIKINTDHIRLDQMLPIHNHEEAVNIIIKSLTELKIIDTLDEINGIGHRVVHGGEKFNESILLNDENISEITELSDLAPLHNPANVMGIYAFRKMIPTAKAVAVFDTAFHQTMPKSSYLYGIPYEWYEKYGVRKYGFHGTSHHYVSKRVSEIINKRDSKIIVCHLGNGGSICAVKNGKSIDTTMGFTPLAGILMGTRSGDIDAAILPYIKKKTNLTLEEIENYLNKRSGLLGISGVSNDSRDIEQGIHDDNERCVLAHEIFVQKIVSYIASYHVLLGGADAIAFTAGIGENSSLVRKDIIKQLEVLGVYLDETANHVRGKEQEISTDESKIKCFVIPTNEELVIARDVMKFI